MGTSQVTCNSVGAPTTYNTSKMTSTVPAVNNFNKSKEDFIWFVKKAVTDKKSYSHSEMYHTLLKMFVDADTNKDGLVSRGSFSTLIDQAAALPRAYGYAPTDSDMWKNLEEKDAARQKMFDSMDLKATGVITFDEWLKFCLEHILAKTATMAPHPMIDTADVAQYKAFIKAAVSKVAGPEHVELYWYMLEIFTEHDTDKDGFVMKAEFPAMMKEFLATPKKLELTCPAETEYDALFLKYDPRKDGKMTVDEWMSLATEEVFKKIIN